MNAFTAPWWPKSCATRSFATWRTARRTCIGGGMSTICSAHTKPCRWQSRLAGTSPVRARTRTCCPQLSMAPRTLFAKSKRRGSSVTRIARFASARHFVPCRSRCGRHRKTGSWTCFSVIRKWLASTYINPMGRMTPSTMSPNKCLPSPPVHTPSRGEGMLSIWPQRPLHHIFVEVVHGHPCVQHDSLGVDPSRALAQEKSRRVGDFLRRHPFLSQRQLFRVQIVIRVAGDASRGGGLEQPGVDRVEADVGERTKRLGQEADGRVQRGLHRAHDAVVLGRHLGGGDGDHHHGGVAREVVLEGVRDGDEGVARD